MGTVRAYLGLGTNLGDRGANLREAVRRLADVGEVAAASAIVETEPWGEPDQPMFMNMVIALDTALSPVELLHAVKRIEEEMGRRPSYRYGPRLIDIDILLMGDEAVHTDELELPHPRMTERDFVMKPLEQIAPDVARAVREREKAR